MQRAHWRLAAASGCLVLMAAGCSKHAAEPGQPSAPVGQATPPAGATLAVAGQFLTGDDPAAIRSYLQTVQEVKPSKFDVKWSPDTVAISRDEAIRALRAISEDGRVFTLASSEPVVAKLKAGSILWIYDVALRRVEAVGADGDTTLVYTRPVALTEAFTSADIEFDSPVNLANYYAGYRPHETRSPAPAAQAALGHRRAPFLRVGNEQPAADPNNSAGEEALALDDYGIGASTQDSYLGKIAGIEFSLGYRASPSKLEFEMEARNEGEGLAEGANAETQRDQRNEFFAIVAEERADEAAKEKAEAAMKGLFGRPNASQVELEVLKKDYHTAIDKLAKDRARAKALAKTGTIATKLFYLAKGNVDVRFRAKVDLDQFAIAGAIKLADGQMSSAMTQFKNVSGKLEYEFIARIGETGSGAINVPVMHVPVVLNEPLPIDGIPFVVQFQADALLKVFMSGKHATHRFKGEYAFSGSGGFNSNKTKTDTNTTLEMKEPQVDEPVAMSPGTSGAVVAVQLPRFGFGLGMFGASALAFIDMVNVMTITNSAGVAALNPPCKRVTWTTDAHIGVETRVMPLPFPLIENIASKVLSQKKTIYHHEWKRVDPPIKMCEA